MNWRDIGDTTLDAFRAALRNTPLEAEAHSLYAVARPHTKLLIAQAKVESDYGRSDLARDAHNFLGQRPRPNDTGLVTPDWFRVFGSFTECARYWIGKITDPTYAYADTETLEQYIHVYAPASDGNNEAEYVVSIEQTIASLPDAGDTPTMPRYSTDIPGLPGGPLVTMHPIRIKLVPEWRTNNRPGIPAQTPRRSVQHGNGNPNSSAEGEANYLYNGAEGRQASYHSTTDDKESWILVPANEVTWQAADGGGPGNMNGFSNEMVEDAALWTDPVRRDRVIANAAELMGAVAARLNIAKPEQHRDFNFNNDPSERHDCPNKLRYTMIGGRLAWDIYVDRWYAAKAAEAKRMKGETEPTPIPTPTKYARQITDWMTGKDKGLRLKIGGVDTNVKVWAVEREYECIARTWRYQGPDGKGPKVGDKLNVRERFTGVYTAKVGNSWWVVTAMGSWIRMSALTPRVSVQAA